MDMAHYYQTLERIALEDDPFSSARKYTIGMDDFAFKPHKDTLKKINVKIEIAVHEKLSDVIVVNIPGYDSYIDGRRNRQLNLANFMHEHIGAVVRCDNHPRMNTHFSKLHVDNARTVMNYVLNNAEQICGNKNPDIYLRGHSAGGSAAAAIAGEYSQIKKLLLSSSGGDAGKEVLEKSLSNYYGELYVTGPLDDKAVGYDRNESFINAAINASYKDIKVLVNCDHGFSGPYWSKVQSKATLWAFKGDKTYPDPKGGIELDDIIDEKLLEDKEKNNKRTFFGLIKKKKQ